MVGRYFDICVVQFCVIICETLLWSISISIHVTTCTSRTEDQISRRTDRTETVHHILNLIFPKYTSGFGSLLQCAITLPKTYNISSSLRRGYSKQMSMPYTKFMQNFSFQFFICCRYTNLKN